jgi:hypothetical protein
MGAPSTFGSFAPKKERKKREQLLNKQQYSERCCVITAKIKLPTTEEQNVFF